MIPVAAQKALMKKEVIVKMNLKATPGRLDNYHQVKKNENKLQEKRHYQKG